MEVIQMKQNSYRRYTIRLANSVDEYIKAESERRGISPTAFIKFIITDYRIKEGAEHGRG
jgi:hypothetical protein